MDHTNPRKVLILQGVSGSGKTSFCERYKEKNPNTIVVSADDHFVGQDGKYRFAPDQLGLAHAKCFAKFMAALAEDSIDTVIVDNTNASALEMNPYVLSVAAANVVREPLDPIAFRILTFEVSDLNTCFNRNQHGVPLKGIKAQDERIREFLAPGYAGNPFRWKVTPVTEDGVVLFDFEESGDE